MIASGSECNKLWDEIFNAATPSGTHRRKCHDNALFCIAATILSYEPESGAERLAVITFVNNLGSCFNLTFDK
ncbi:hypothetical protein RB195_018389 [Necator americanus]|uniref:Uncharacterized protein n=1 Tax=Necator americanus TaxID=51031 RepID=A0ABR1CAN2_NECAM